MWICDDRIDCKKPCDLRYYENVLTSPQFCPFDGTRVKWISKWIRKKEKQKITKKSRGVVEHDKIQTDNKRPDNALQF